MENSNWTESKTNELVELWKLGHSASKIAELLGGGVTRNAVIGKLNRLGFSKKYIRKATIK